MVGPQRGGIGGGRDDEAVRDPEAGSQEFTEIGALPTGDSYVGRPDLGKRQHRGGGRRESINEPSRHGSAPFPDRE